MRTTAKPAVPHGRDKPPRTAVLPFSAFMTVPYRSGDDARGDDHAGQGVQGVRGGGGLLHPGHRLGQERRETQIRGFLVDDHQQDNQFGGRPVHCRGTPLGAEVREIGQDPGEPAGQPACSVCLLRRIMTRPRSWQFLTDVAAGGTPLKVSQRGQFPWRRPTRPPCSRSPCGPGTGPAARLSWSGAG